MVVEEVILLCTDVPVKLQEIHTVITFNRIWKLRLCDIAIVTKNIIETYGLSGVIIRASNVKKDLRFIGYEYYNNLSIGINTGVKGDCLDRYLIRMNESLESIKLLLSIRSSSNIINT